MYQGWKTVFGLLFSKIPTSSSGHRTIHYSTFVINLSVNKPQRGLLSFLCKNLLILHWEACSLHFAKPFCSPQTQTQTDTASLYKSWNNVWGGPHINYSSTDNLFEMMLHNQYFWQSHKFHRTRWFGPTANKQVPLNTPCASLNMSFIFVLFVCFNTPNSIPLLTSWQIFFLFIFIYLFIYLFRRFILWGVGEITEACLLPSNHVG